MDGIFKTHIAHIDSLSFPDHWPPEQYTDSKSIIITFHFVGGASRRTHPKASSTRDAYSLINRSIRWWNDEWCGCSLEFTLMSHLKSVPVSQDAFMSLDGRTWGGMFDEFQNGKLSTHLVLVILKPSRCQDYVRPSEPSHVPASADVWPPVMLEDDCLIYGLNIKPGHQLALVVS